MGDRLELASAIRSHMGDVTVEELGVRVADVEGRSRPYAQSAVSGWLSGQVELTPCRVFAIERALGVRPGVISRVAGYQPVGREVGCTVPVAVESDPGLSVGQRADLLALWAAMRARSGG